MDSYQLPPGKSHDFLVFIHDWPTSPVLNVPSAYVARERAAVREGVSPCRIRVRLMGEDICNPKPEK